MVQVREDMTGWVISEYGVPDSRLTVIGRAEDYVSPSGKTRKAQWMCECSCCNHNIVIATRSDLLNGHTKSCGCMSLERILAFNKNCHKTNTYSEPLTDEYGCYYIGEATNTGSKFFIDSDDFDKIKNYCWSESVQGYIVSQKPNEQIPIRMHNFITGYEMCDHKDRNRKNNRRYNLRPATIGENCRNISIRKDNTSNIIGVSWDKRRSKWRSYIQFENKNKHLGYFLSKKDAIVTRLQAEAKYFKEFAPQRHLFEQYEIKVNTCHMSSS